MSLRPRTAILGVVIGLVAAVVLLPAFGGRGGGRRATPRGPLVSDCGGSLRELVIHYVPEAAEIVETAYRAFLRQVPPEVVVHVVCPDVAAFEDLSARVGPTACRLSAVPVGHAMTTWSRDRWLALAPWREGGAATLVCPCGEDGAAVWPARRGDERTADDLAATLEPRVIAVRSELYFDGGDFVADGKTVFVTPAVLRRNLQRTVETRDELVERLGALTGRRVVLLDVAPDHHAGMFMMCVGEQTVVVGDPGAGRRCLADVGADELARLCPTEGPDFGPVIQGEFDAVARQCHEAGYRVVRMPIVPGRDGRTYLTCLNVILDRRAGRRVVYMPTVAGAEPLARAAARVWGDLGWQVRPVDCTACYRHFGTLRCLVNVLSRG